MKKIYFDITDSQCEGHSTGLKKLEKELSNSLKGLINNNFFSEFICTDGRIIEVEKDGSLGQVLFANNINQFKNSDIIISVGQSWATPQGSPRIKTFIDLKKICDVKMALCCTSMISEVIPHWTSPVVAKSERKLFINFLIEKADLVLCYSNDTANQFINHRPELKNSLKDKVKIFRMGDEIRPSKKSDETDTSYSYDFILYVSTLERRKNHELIYKAYRKILETNKNITLPKVIFAGKKRWGVDQLIYEIENDPLVSSYFKIIDFISDDLLNSLYKNAKFCVYPSLYEGWGLPVGEALALKKIVISSNSTSLCEVGGSFAIYLDPYDVLSWAAFIEKLITDDDFYQASAQTASKYIPYSWSKTGRDLFSIIQGL